jgi:hypothetical protein
MTHISYLSFLSPTLAPPNQEVGCRAGDSECGNQSERIFAVADALGYDARFATVKSFGNMTLFRRDTFEYVDHQVRSVCFCKSVVCFFNLRVRYGICSDYFVCFAYTTLLSQTTCFDFQLCALAVSFPHFSTFCLTINSHPLLQVLKFGDELKLIGLNAAQRRHYTSKRQCALLLELRYECQICQMYPYGYL